MIATAYQLCKVFRRNATCDTPEKCLLFAVLEQAVHDLKCEDPPREVEDFVRRHGFAGLCESIDLSVEWVRQELSTHTSFVMDKQHKRPPPVPKKASPYQTMAFSVHDKAVA